MIAALAPAGQQHGYICNPLFPEPIHHILRLFCCSERSHFVFKEAFFHFRSHHMKQQGNIAIRLRSILRQKSSFLKLIPVFCRHAGIICIFTCKEGVCQHRIHFISLLLWLSHHLAVGNTLIILTAINKLRVSPGEFYGSILCSCRGRIDDGIKLSGIHSNQETILLFPVNHPPERQEHLMFLSGIIIGTIPVQITQNGILVKRQIISIYAPAIAGLIGLRLRKPDQRSGAIRHHHISRHGILINASEEAHKADFGKLALSCFFYARILYAKGELFIRNTYCKGKRNSKLFRRYVTGEAILLPVISRLEGPLGKRAALFLSLRIKIRNI